MNTESYPYRKRVRAMGTALAIVSLLGLLSWLLTAVLLLFFPSWTLMSAPKEGMTYFERLMGEDAPDPKVATDEELRNHFETQFTEVKPDLPDGVTEEIYADTMIYFVKMRAGLLIGGVYLDESDVFPDSETGDSSELEKMDDLFDPSFGWDFAYLSGGMTADSTIRELILKDRAFFEAHKGIYQLLSIVAAVFFSIVSIVVLRMALFWRKGDPFGPGTVQGLRWLGILFLVQFLASWAGLFVPHSGFDLDFTYYSSIFDDLYTDLFTGGGGLSSGIVLLTLSWVIEYGRKMKEEQALTI